MNEHQKSKAYKDIEIGRMNPYDATDAWREQEQRTPLPEINFAVVAARGIIENLQRRSYIGDALDEIKERIRQEIVDDIANIIMAVHQDWCGH